MESKKAPLTAVESKILVTRDSERRINEDGEILIKDFEVLLRRNKLLWYNAKNGESNK